MTLKVGVYLTDDVARRFTVALRRPRTTKSALVNEALACFLSPPPIKEPGEEALEALRALGKRMQRLQRDTLVLSETLAVFVRYVLMVTPPVPESERPAAKALGRERYQVFVKEIAKRISSDKRMVTDVLRTIVATHPHLVAEAVARADAENKSMPLPFGDAHAAQACKLGEAGSHA